MIRVRKEAIQKDRIEPYFEQWENLSKEIYAAHDERDSKKAKNLMEQGIALYKELMVNTSDTDVEELLVHEEYEGMPLNGMERFQFIKSRPGQYACYVQLDELFKEVKKRFARLRVQK
ncbi:YpoC family protein [Ureibacillus sp. FSL W7-1570]|uniref:YpoC family protein n=1 Tax=Ureibacillus sp. FSL W7-1570 TaxID=2954593 RepID=UPI00315A3888